MNTRPVFGFSAAASLMLGFSGCAASGVLQDADYSGPAATGTETVIDLRTSTAAQLTAKAVPTIVAPKPPVKCTYLNAAHPYDDQPRFGYTEANTLKAALFNLKRQLLNAEAAGRVKAADGWKPFCLALADPGRPAAFKTADGYTIVDLTAK